MGQGAPLLFPYGLGSGKIGRPRYRTSLTVIESSRPTQRPRPTDKPPGPYSVPMMARDVIDLLDGLGIGSTHIVGLSMGGMIAFQLGSSGRSGWEALSSSIAGRRWWREQSGMAAHSATAVAGAAFGPARTGHFLSKRLFPKADQSLCACSLSNAGRKMSAMPIWRLCALVGWSVLERIDEIRCPVLVISGDRDYTPWS